jgi:hypothetical protein
MKKTTIAIFLVGLIIGFYSNTIVTNHKSINKINSKTIPQVLGDNIIDIKTAGAMVHSQRDHEDGNLKDNQGHADKENTHYVWY